MNTADSSRSSEQGSSLVEVLFAVSVTLVVVLSVAGLFGRGLGLVRSGRDTTIASALAQQKVDQLLSQGDNAAALGTGSWQEPMAGGLVRSWTVAVNPEAAQARTIVVTVSRAGSRPPQLARLVTVRAQ